MLWLLPPQSKRYKRKPKATRDNGSLGPGGERAISIPQITYDHIDDKDGVFSDESSGNTSLLFSSLLPLKLTSVTIGHVILHLEFSEVTKKCIAYHNTIYFALGSFIDDAVFVVGMFSCTDFINLSMNPILYHYCLYDLNFVIQFKYSFTCALHLFWT